MRSLLNAAGTDEGIVLATVIDDYAIEIYVADITDGYPIVAYCMDGKEMSRRDKGPLWVMYPFDSEVNFSRTTWQLGRLSASE